MNYKISNKTLFILLCPIYLIIILFIFFIFGLSKVDAATYMTIFDNDNVGRDLLSSYTNGSRYNYVGKLSLPAFSAINDSFDFQEGFVYRLRVNISMSYYLPLSFNNPCSSFGRSAVLKVNNRNGSTISTLSRLWSMNSCSIVSYGNGWKYDFSYSFDATFEASQSLDDYDRISWYTGLNSPSSTGNFAVEYTLTGFNVFNLGASDDKNTQDMINSINNAIQSQIDNDNKNTQAIIDSIVESNKTQQETNDKLDDINDYISDDSSPSLDSFNNYAGWLEPGPVDSILNLPLTILNNLTKIFGNSCVGTTIPLPYVDKEIELPCIDTIYSKIEGLNVVINTICVPVGAYILFKYFMGLYKWVDDTLTFRENNYIDNWGGI